MNIEELKLKSKEIKYAIVKGRAQEEHFRAVVAFGVDPELVIEKAFQELYEQLERKGLLQKLTSSGTVTERLPPIPARGEVTVDVTGGTKHEKLKADILALMDKHPEQNFYQGEFVDYLSTGQAQVSAAMRELVAEGAVRETQDGTKKRYWNPRYGDPNLAEFTAMNSSIATR